MNKKFTTHEQKKRFNVQFPIDADDSTNSSVDDPWLPDLYFATEINNCADFANTYNCICISDYTLNFSKTWSDIGFVAGAHLGNDRFCAVLANA